ncbi:MAG TPA: hypothetical protein VHX43_07430, partial [Xanthobacteraceae bacterium]|nr:hypothetical protein [Xanthobacteraceae bacterium]
PWLGDSHAPKMAPAGGFYEAAFPGRSAARSGALQTRDLHNRRAMSAEFVTAPDQRCTANALHRIRGTALSSRGNPE